MNDKRKKAAQNEKEDMEFLKKQQMAGKDIRRRGPGGPMLKEKPKNLKGTLRRLISYIGKSKYLLMGLFAASLAATVIGLIAPILQKEAIDAVHFKTAEDTYIFNESRLIQMLISLGVLYLVNSGMTFFLSAGAAKLSQRTVYSLRRDLFNNMVRLPVKFTDTHQHGDLMSRMTNDVDNVSNTISQSMTSLFSGIVSIVGTFGIMFYYSWQMTLIAFVTIPATIFVSMFMGKFMRKYFVRQQKVLGQLNGHIEEMVTGYSTVVAYSHEKKSVEEFEVLSDDLRRTGIKANIFGSIMGPIMNCIGNAGFLLVAVSGGYFAVRGDISLGAILMFIQYSKNITRPINEIANLYTGFLTAIAGAERVFEVMDAKKEDEEELPDIDVASVKGDIDFDNIGFAYKEGEPVLKGFDLHVKQGQKIAIVGRTGSGKTTVVNLLTRFYDIDSGKIRLDDEDIKDISKRSLRSSIAIVLQDTVLFTDTIANNIRYGKLDATDEEVRAAARTANADVFIERLPEGYDTVLTGSGSNLSQGQRQLISIARAVLADPKILILDEATSSVDTRTEMQIQQAMLNLMHNRTSLVIAHRLSTIRDADKIIVLSDGHIVESGSHDELLAQNGVYHDLYMTQFSGVQT